MSGGSWATHRLLCRLAVVVAVEGEAAVVVEGVVVAVEGEAAGTPCW